MSLMRATIEDLKLLSTKLSYNSRTGIFTWLMGGTKFKKLIGKPAGHKDPKGYVIIHMSKTSIKAHRLAWFFVYGEDTKRFIDHIDGNPSNNRISNLRKSTNQQNTCNQKINCTNKSGYKGIYKITNTRKWGAKIIYKGKAYYLGRFDSPKAAAKAYDNKAKELHKVFAKVNF